LSVAGPPARLGAGSLREAASVERRIQGPGRATGAERDRSGPGLGAPGERGRRLPPPSRVPPVPDGPTPGERPPLDEESCLAWATRDPGDELVPRHR